MSKVETVCRVLALVGALSLALPAAAQIAVADPWVRGTVAGQKATGAFMQLKSSTDTALVGAASPVAKIVEIHEMKMEGGMMKMSAIDKLPLPAGKTVDLKPGGYHVMLMDLTQELKDGQTVPGDADVRGQGRQEDDGRCEGRREAACARGPRGETGGRTSMVEAPCSAPDWRWRTAAFWRRLDAPAAPAR